MKVYKTIYRERYDRVSGTGNYAFFHCLFTGIVSNCVGGTGYITGANNVYFAGCDTTECTNNDLCSAMYVLSTNIVANQLCCYRCCSPTKRQTYEFSGSCYVEDGSFALSPYYGSNSLQSCFTLANEPQCEIGNISSLNFSNNHVNTFDPGIDCGASSNNIKFIFTRDCTCNHIHTSGYNSQTCNFYDFVMVNNSAKYSLFYTYSTGEIYMENIIVFGAIPKIITNLAKTTLIVNSWFEQKPQSVMYFSERNNHYATVMPQEFYGKVPIDLCFTNEAADPLHYYIICFGGSLLIPTLSMNI